MPKPHLLSLIVRLALGFVVLGVVGVLLFAKLKKPSPTPTSSSSPTAGSDLPVTIVTPTSEPSQSSLPEPAMTTTSQAAPHRAGRVVTERTSIAPQPPTTHTSTSTTSTSNTNASSQTFSSNASEANATSPGSSAHAAAWISGDGATHAEASAATN